MVGHIRWDRIQTLGWYGITEHTFIYAVRKQSQHKVLFHIWQQAARYKQNEIYSLNKIYKTQPKKTYKTKKNV